MFRVILVLSRMAVACICALGVYALATSVPSRLPGDLDSLPDFDWRSFARQKWNNGNQAAALAALEYVIENRLPDAPACSALYSQYLEDIRARKSLCGRAIAAGKGFLLGDIDGWDSLAGAAVADLFLYGDLRDMARESFAGDQRDNFVLALASAGAATSALSYIPATSAGGIGADISLSLLKSLKKAGALSASMARQVADIAGRAAEGIKKCAAAKDIAGAKRIYAEMLEGLSPVYELSKRTKTWSEFSTIMASVGDLGQLKKLNAVLKEPKKARTLERALLVDSANSKKISAYAAAGGDLAVLNDSMRKGWVGVGHVLNQTKKGSRILKNARKAYVQAKEDLSEMLLKNGWQLRWALLGAFALIGTLCIVSPASAYRIAGDVSKGAPRRHKIWRTVQFFILIFAAEGVLFFIFARPLRHRESLKAFNSSAVWRIDSQIKEDHFLNEERICHFLTPAVKIGENIYLPVSLQRLGFTWREISKGGVYKLCIVASKSGENPVSFLVESIILPRHPLGMALIKVGADTGFFAAGGPPEIKDALCFSSEFGATNKNAELHLADSGFVCPAGSAQIGDCLIGNSNKYYGMFLDAENRSLKCSRLPSAAELEGAEQIILTKPADSTYYTEFCRQISRLQKDGQIPEDLGGK